MQTIFSNYNQIQMRLKSILSTKSFFSTHTFTRQQNTLRNFFLTLIRGKQNSLWRRKLLLATSITAMSFLYYQNEGLIMKAIEDRQIIKLKTEMIREINKLKSQFGQMTIYPEVKYDLRGNTYTVQFQIDQRKCDIFELLTNFFSVYNGDKSFRVSDLKAFTQGDVVTWYVDFVENDPNFKTPQGGRLTITGIKNNQRPMFRLIFEKNDLITSNNTAALIISYKQAVKPKQYRRNYQESSQQNKKNSQFSQSQQKVTPRSQLYKKMEQFGVTIFDPNDKSLNLDWDYLAGYQKQKRAIEDTILLALNYPHIYDEITQKTRVKYEPNRPKAVLFQGPPGTGKTTSAKIISQQVNIPLIYMPIEAIMSKFYGQSQRKLSDMWQLCKKMGKVIIFIDQIDALAGNRSSDMHQASRRVLSTLLRKIDSFESTTDVLLVCATNRKQDLDPAMLSRIDLSIQFSLPDKQSRAAIFKRYAKHLTQEDRVFLAQQTQGFSGRNISDVCKHAQRRWASKLIRKEVDQKLPDLKAYVASLHQRKQTQLS